MSKSILNSIFYPYNPNELILEFSNRQLITTGANEWLFSARKRHRAKTHQVTVFFIDHASIGFHQDFRAIQSIWPCSEPLLAWRNLIAEIVRRMACSVGRKLCHCPSLDRLISRQMQRGN